MSLLLIGTSSCSSEDKLLERPSRFGATSTTKRSNDRSRTYKARNTIGLGLDLHSNDPNKFHKVKAPKKHKYSKAR